MKIENGKLLLNEEGFELGDGWGKILNPTNDSTPHKRSGYLALGKTEFEGFNYLPMLYFDNDELQIIELYPAFKDYLPNCGNKGEMFGLKSRIAESLRKKYRAEGIKFIGNGKRIDIIDRVDTDGFLLEIRKISS